MNTDGYLLHKFKQSRIYDSYVLSIVSLEEEIVRHQVPETMYALLVNLAEESSTEVSCHDKMLKVLQYDLVEELCSRISAHEAILVLQSGLGGKFYRDHLRHMLRVMLLTHLIGDRLGLHRNKLLACALAGLFHDIAYPLSKAEETIYNLSQSLTRSYPYFDIQSGSLRLFPSQDEIDKVLNICKEKKLSNLGKRTNHAILSALAFLNFWNSESIEQDKNLREVVYLATHAIAVHDSEIKRTVTYSQDPVSAILILADELQDWGRPVGWDESSWIAIPNIEPFLVTKVEIRAGFDYSRSAEYSHKTDNIFSPLLQIQSKQENMSRIVLDDGFPTLSLTYELPAYGVLSEDSILSCVKDVQRYEKAAIEKVIGFRDLEEFLMSAPMAGEFSIKRLEQLGQFEHLLFSILCDAVAKSKVPLHLHYNVSTGEYVIHSGKKVPTKIVATKNRKGKIEWNYRITELEKPLKSIPLPRSTLGLRTGRFCGYVYHIPFDEAKDRLQLINHSQPVQSFVALLQLLPWIYFETAEIWRKGYKQVGYSEYEIQQDKDFDLSSEALDVIELLHHTYDPRCRFFLLESSKQ